MGHFDIRDGWGSDQRELAGPDHVLWIVLGIEGGGCVCPLEVSYRLGRSNIPVHAFDYEPGVYYPNSTIQDIDGTLGILEG
jgi:hypothetical protein